MNTLETQQWRSPNDRLTSLTGTQVMLALVRYLVGVSDGESELERVKRVVERAEVGGQVQDAYGTSYVRIK